MEEDEAKSSFTSKSSSDDVIRAIPCHSVPFRAIISATNRGDQLNSLRRMITGTQNDNAELNDDVTPTTPAPAANGECTERSGLEDMVSTTPSAQERNPTATANAETARAYPSDETNLTSARTPDELEEDARTARPELDPPEFESPRWNGQLNARRRPPCNCVARGRATCICSFG